MTYSRLLACFTAAALLASCSQDQDSGVGQVADDAAQAEMTAMDSTANDGGIPLRLLADPQPPAHLIDRRWRIIWAVPANGRLM